MQIANQIALAIIIKFLYLKIHLLKYLSKNELTTPLIVTLYIS